MTKKILAIGHKKGRGKDSLARFIIAELRNQTRGLNIIKRSFAYKLKLTCHILYSWTGLKSPDHYEDHPAEKDILIPKLGKSPRRLWIDFGQHTRKLDDQVFINSTLNDDCDIMILPDLRFPIEAQAIHQRKGFVVRLNRPGYSTSTDEDEADSPLNNWDKWDADFSAITLPEIQEAAVVIVNSLFKEFLNGR